MPNQLLSSHNKYSDSVTNTMQRQLQFAKWIIYGWKFIYDLNHKAFRMAKIQSKHLLCKKKMVELIYCHIYSMDSSLGESLRLLKNAPKIIMEENMLNQNNHSMEFLFISFHFQNCSSPSTNLKYFHRKFMWISFKNSVYNSF